MTEEDVRGIIESNFCGIKQIEKRIDEISDTDSCLRGIEAIGCLYSEYITGIYSSYQLEEKVIGIAQKIDGLYFDAKPEKNHVLIVMTEAGSVGGHTALVNNWIKLDKKRQYSIAFTGTSEFIIPDFIIDSIKISGGEIIKIDNPGIIERAQKLSEISTRYERILLFSHMYDIVPLIAYSSPNWKIPVFFYHHADFRFTFGLSVADYIFTICEYDLNRMKRINGIDESKCSVMWPPNGAVIEQSFVYEHDNLNKESVFEKYNIPMGSKLIVSMGADYKYDPIIGYDFADFAVSLLNKYGDEAFILIIGADPNKKRWIEMNERTGGKAIALGELPIAEASELIAASDLYIVSFPMGASGAEIAEKNGIPYITLSLTEREKSFKKCVCFDNVDELLDAACSILSENLKYNEYQLQASDSDNWNELWDSIYDKVDTHRVHPFYPIREVAKNEIINCQLLHTGAAKKTGLFLCDRPVLPESVLSSVASFDGRITYFVNSELHRRFIEYKSAYLDHKAALEQKKALADKHLMLFHIMTDMFRMKEDGRSFKGYFLQNNFKTAAIYGMSDLGKSVLKELYLCGIHCPYGIDKKADILNADVKVLSPQEAEKAEKVDVIINATTLENSGILKEFSILPAKRILSVREILNGIYEDA